MDQMEALQELVDVISMKEFLDRESKNLGKLPPSNLLEKPADLWNFFEVRASRVFFVAQTICFVFRYVTLDHTDGASCCVYMFSYILRESVVALA